MPDPAPDELVWEEPPARGSRNPIVLKHRTALEAAPGKTARVLICATDKEAAGTAQAFNRLPGFKAEYRKLESDNKYRVWATYTAPTEGTPPAPDPDPED